MNDSIDICVDGKNLLRPISGISRYINETINLLADEGTNVKLICPNYPLNVYKLNEKIDVITDKNNKPVNVLQWHGWRLGHLANKISGDIFWGPAHRIPFGLKKNIATVVTCHDLVCIKYRNTMPFKNYISDRIQLPLAMRRANSIHAISQTTLEDISFHFPKLATKTFSTLPHTSHDFTTDYPKKLLNKKQWGRYALFVGTFEPRKNLKNLIKAFRLVCDRYNGSAKLILAGSKGWGKVDIFKMIAAENLEKNVEVFLRPNDPDLAKLYAHCRFLIMPSLYEGLGLPVIEAKIHGKPTIITKGSLKEISDRNSITVDPQNVNDIAKAMEKLFFNDHIYQKYLEDALYLPSNFQWSTNTKNLLRHFHEIIFKCQNL